MAQPHIVFIGAGNMASAIIGGLIVKGTPADKITACAPSEQTRSAISKRFCVNTCADNAVACAHANIVILSVKPQMTQAVCKEIAASLPSGCLVISVIAGITCRSLQLWLKSPQSSSSKVSIIRTMPNTPSQVGLGAAGLFANLDATDAHKQQAQDILMAVGKTIWVDDECLINTVTAVSGSGPAYFFLVFEAMIAEGVAQGLSYEDAKTLTLQTALGAATLAEQQPEPVANLRKKVTSPNGTTEQAIKVFESLKLKEIFAKAMKACARRAQELSNT